MEGKEEDVLRNKVWYGTGRDLIGRVTVRRLERFCKPGIGAARGEGI